MSLMNQHLGISKGWPSWLLLRLEKCRSEWKGGKARQWIVILRGVFSSLPYEKWTTALEASEIVLGSRWETSRCLCSGSAKFLSWCCVSRPSFSSTRLDLSSALPNVLIGRWLAFKMCIMLIIKYYDLKVKMDLCSFFLFSPATNLPSNHSIKALV